MFLPLILPELLSAIATREEWDAYEKWRRVDEMTKCYMLASMSNVLQHQHQNFSYCQRHFS